MDQYLDVLKNLIRDISIPGALVAVSYFVLRLLNPLTPAVSRWIQGKSGTHETLNEKGEAITLTTIDDHIQALETNHFHEITGLLGEIKSGQDRIERLLQSSASDMSHGQSEILQRLSSISARLNGQ